MRKFITIGVLTFALSVTSFPANAMGIYVELISNKFIVLDVEPDDTIVGVKAKIFDNQGIPIENQFLFFGNLLLEDNKALWEYNIQKESRLLLSPNPRIAENTSQMASQQRQQNEFLSILMLVPVIAALSFALSKLLISVTFLR